MHRVMDKLLQATLAQVLLQHLLNRMGVVHAHDLLE